MWFGLVIAAIGGIAQCIQLEKAERFCVQLDQYDKSLKTAYAAEETVNTTATDSSDERACDTESDDGVHYEESARPQI